MKTFLTKKPVKLLLVAAFWVIIWQLASTAIGETLFLPSPVQVVNALFGMVAQGGFWQSVARSLLRITLGFALAFLLGVALAWASSASSFVYTLISPIMQLLRATPVASFIILALVWLNGTQLSVFTSLVIALPVLFGATYTGIKAADEKLLEMAKVFRISFGRKIRAIYLPALLPALLNACELAMGMAWKSGIAAEVIGLPSGTIGERLYQAKLYLMMPELFGWTVVIILCSWALAKLVLALLRTLSRFLTKQTRESPRLAVYPRRRRG